MAEPLALTRFARITARLQKGESRATVLGEEGLPEQAWVEAQSYWLREIANQQRLGKNTLPRHFMALMLAEQRHLGLVEDAERETPPPARPLLQLKVGLKEYIPQEPAAVAIGPEPPRANGGTPPHVEAVAAVPPEPASLGVVPSFLLAAEPSSPVEPPPAVVPLAAPAVVPLAAPAVVPLAAPAVVPLAAPAVVPLAAPAVVPLAAPAVVPPAPVAPGFLTPPVEPPEAVAAPAPMAPAFLSSPLAASPAFVPPPTAPVAHAAVFAPASGSLSHDFLPSPVPRLADASVPDFLRVSAAAPVPAAPTAAVVSQAAYLQALMGPASTPTPRSFPEVVPEHSPRLSLLGWFEVKRRLNVLTSTSEQAQLLATAGLDDTTWAIEERIWRSLITSCPMTQAMYQELLGSTP